MRWWWRKRADGFEWREYVRTTILVRRNERRQKVEDAKQAAIFGVKQAGQKSAEAGAAGVEAAGRAGRAAAGAVGRGGVALGRSAAGAGASLASAVGRGAVAAARASRHGLAAGGAAAGRATASGFSRPGSAASPHLARARDGALHRLEPAVQTLLRPSIAMPLTIVALTVGAGALFRWATLGLDGDVMVAGAIAVVAGLLTLLPRMAVGETPRPLAAIGKVLGRGLHGLGGLRSMSRATGAAIAVALVALLAGAWWFLAPPGLQPQTATVTSGPADDSVPSVAVTRLPDLKGRGSAQAGDLVRVGGTTVKLSGVDAPERDQRCVADDGRSWRCGQSAQDALARLIRSQQIVCALGATDETGFRLATCKVGQKDVAAELVRGGHVFAATGFFSRYGAEESEARGARAGIWRGAEVERPAEYRSKRWEAAKAQAPQGCPIKGSVSRGARTYVLPWSPSYERVRVRESRGERWFCSEQEARAAGWRPTAL